MKHRSKAVQAEEQAINASTPCPHSWQCQRHAVLVHACICCRAQGLDNPPAHHVRGQGRSRWPGVLPRALEVLQADGAGLRGVLLAAERSRLLPPQLVYQRLAPPAPPVRRPVSPACIHRQLGTDDMGLSIGLKAGTTMPIQQCDLQTGTAYILSFISQHLLPCA